jgi:formylmethanofuran dehydrogenase subunit E
MGWKRPILPNLGKEKPKNNWLTLFHETAFFYFGKNMDIQHLLEISSRDHSHLCPRQILGVRLGLRGLCALQLEPNLSTKRILTIIETDGCFADGISAATNCTVGHRTLRVEDYGKTAATFVDTKTGLAYRIAPKLDIREKAYQFAPGEPRHYFAQMQAYQIMPDEEMFTVNEVQLTTPIEALISRPGIRTNCSICGEEIMNEREINHEQTIICRACAGKTYYQMPITLTAERIACFSNP